MENKQINDLKEAVTSLNVQNSTTLSTIEVGSTSLLSNKPITPDLTAVGTSYATQNNLQLSDISRQKDRYDLLEIDWTYKNATSKPYVVATGNWSSEAAGAVLKTFRFPIDYFAANHVLAQIGNTFLSVRADLHCVFTLQGVIAASGAIMATPNYLPTTTTGVLDRFFRQNIILDASDNSSTADLVVPFKFFRNGTDPASDIFDVVLQVLVPLAGITQLSWTLTCFLENQEFKFLRPQAVSTFRTTQGLFNITTINNSLSNVENATLPTNMQGDTFDIAPGLMDDVGVPTNPTAVIIKYNSLNNVDNPHAIEKVALHASTQQVSTYDIFNTKIDEMSFNHLLKEREHWFQLYSINTSLVSGQSVANIAVTPAPKVFTTPANSAYNMNIMEYYSQFFKFWRGGLKFRFRFFMNRFQSIKLYFGLFYKAVSPTVFTDWSSSHGVIVDIGGDQREVILEIPYNAETPFLQVPHNLMDNVNSSFDSTIFDYIMGQLGVYALTPLISPEGSPTSITMHVTMMAADDFEFATYTPSRRSAQAESILMSKKSLRTPEYLTDTVVSVKELVKKWQIAYSVNYPTNVANYRFLTFCPSWLFNPPLVQTNYTTTVIQNIAEGSPKMKMNGIAPFTAYRGSIKVRIELGASGVQLNLTPVALYFNPDFFKTSSDTDWAATGGALENVSKAMINFLSNSGSVIPEQSTPYVLQPINNTNIGTDYIYEVEIPWQRNIKYHQINGSINYRNFGVIMFGFLAKSTAAYVLSAKVLYKIGDDGRFGVINTGFGNALNYDNWCNTN